MLKRQLKEVLLSILPIIGLVVLLHFTITPIPALLFQRFLIGSVFVILGLTLFLLGVEMGITPLGSYTGAWLAKSNKLWFVLLVGAGLGFIISIAEPGLMVLANQVSGVTNGAISSILILVVVSVGLALMLALGFLRIFYNIPLYKLLLVLYGMIGLMALGTSKEFLAISFDASGSTTGILAVPFILALSVGISKLKKDSKASEKDSFGLVAIASTGAIMAVLVLDLLTHTQSFHAELETTTVSQQGIWSPFVSLIGPLVLETLGVILPLFLLFLFLQWKVLALKPRAFRKMLTGFVFSYLGLFLFMVGVNGGFMAVGSHIGQDLVMMANKLPIILIGFTFGMVTILAEPAVYVLTHQIEQVTSGYVKRKAVLIPLALGVGLAVGLSVLRIVVPSIQLWHYLLPGYVLSLLLMFVTPKLFIGMAFDAGGVATGPMTATLILAFIQGAAHVFEGADLLVDGFGMIAMVALAPIITIQLLGFGYHLKSKRH
ncbi:DUF1538 domain-containing protein [Streptococcus moroccensis]|uniref:DUF1538 domain-containing protein n=1 Tax=Streptococcus moroccensis TaxID=1451356 RepID=A0ABT9YP32_9STRE|nr:DUF1538 domain-containing protein [Streptococcus moroccensis]MDQ0221743.1 hypothetical protein [Streptococcus moroccensis]